MILYTTIFTFLNKYVFIFLYKNSSFKYTYNQFYCLHIKLRSFADRTQIRESNTKQLMFID